MFDYQSIHQQLRGALSARTHDVCKKVQKAQQHLEMQDNKDALAELLLCSEIIFSSRIEKVDLTLGNLFLSRQSESAVVLAEPKSSNMRRVYERSQENAKGSLTKEDLLALHGVAFKHDAHSMPGKFRDRIVGIGNKEKNIVYFTPAQPDAIPQLMDDFLNYYNQPNADDLDAIVRMAISHVAFETIHPFLDGNGRMGRLLISLGMQCQFPGCPLPVSAHISQEKKSYYSSLLDIQKADCAPLNLWQAWGEYLLDSIENAASLLPNVINAVAQAVEIDFLAYPERSEANKMLKFLLHSPVTSLKIIKEYMGDSAEELCALLKDDGIISIRYHDMVKPEGTIITYKSFMDSFVQIPWAYTSTQSRMPPLLEPNT